MAITDDISIVLSGGATNTNPNASLGGDPSPTPITNNVLNNIFDDIGAEQSEDGYEDYRCVYIFNDGTSTITGIDIFILENFAGGSLVEIGIEDRNEAQRIRIADGIPSGGSFTIEIDGETIVSAFEGDLSDWATTLQGQFNALSLFNDVIVTAGNSSPTTILFDVVFSGEDGRRNQENITLTSNDMIPAVSINISTTISGAPINTIAENISVETTPPGGVGFFVASAVSPITIPKLTSGEGFPMWFKRVQPPTTDPQENDGFTLRISGEGVA